MYHYAVVVPARVLVRVAADDGAYYHMALALRLNSGMNEWTHPKVGHEASSLLALASAADCTRCSFTTTINDGARTTSQRREYLLGLW